MNTNLISTLPQVDMTSFGTASSGTSSGVDFAQILAGLSTQDSTGLGLTADSLLLGNESYGDLLSSGLLGGDFLAETLLSGEFSNLDILGLGGIDLSHLEGLAGQIMQQLFAAPENEEEQTLLALIDSLQAELETLAEEAGQVVLGEQLMNLLAQISGQTQTPSLQADGTLAWSLPNTQEAIALLVNASSQDVLQALQGKATLGSQASPLQTPSQTQTSDAAPASTAAGTQNTAVQATTNTAMQTATTAGDSGQNTAAGTTSSNGTNAESTDSQVATNTALPLMQQPGLVTTGNVTTAEAAPAFLTQMQSGIESGLQSGLDEFTVKLMPEGLGEVVVQLKATENGLTLTLIAQSAEAQRLLAADLEQLRNSLSPLHVEVQEVQSSEDAELLNEHQNEREERRAYWQAQTQQNLVRRTVRGEPEALPETQNTLSSQPTSALDTYI